MSMMLVLITGGRSGIGKEIASSFVKKGVRVVVLDIQDPDFTRINSFKGCNSYLMCINHNTDENVAFYHADVTSSESIRAAATKISAEHGHPTVLIQRRRW